MKLASPWIDRPETKAVCAALTDAGFDAYFVGGCVRNTLMDRAVSDIDIATNALPEQTIQCAEKAGLKAIPTGIDHGTVTVVSGKLVHEITTFRADIDTDGRHASVRFSDCIHEDAARRDFTMNALYARPDGTVVDPLGGYDDLQAGRVRFIGNADARITEDFLRSLRFFRFFAWYGDQANGLDADGMDAVARNLDGLGQLSRERVGAEMLKLLSAPDPAQAVAGLKQTGALARLLPGSDDAALAPAVHLEQLLGLSVDPIVRLAALGGEDVADRLRLSKSQAKRLEVLRDESADVKSMGHLGHLYGASEACGIEVLRASFLQRPIGPNVRAEACAGAEAVFPVRAKDLMPEYSGKALGNRLDEIKARWIASGFTAGKDELLA